jgi:hypothetical protein
MTSNQHTEATFTTDQALDEAVLLIIRKLGRFHSEAYAAVLKKLPDGAREALARAEIRADIQRDADERAGIAIGSRGWPTDLELDDSEE